MHVETQYLEEDSSVAENRFVFAYTITIENRGAAPAQLLNRHWVITDGEGGVQEVRGEGVVGQQPNIPPNRGFRYTSGCVLTTPVGTMHDSTSSSAMTALCSRCPSRCLHSACRILFIEWRVH